MLQSTLANAQPKKTSIGNNNAGVNRYERPLRMNVYAPQIASARNAICRFARPVSRISDSFIAFWRSTSGHWLPASGSFVASMTIAVTNMHVRIGQRVSQSVQDSR